MQIIFLSFTETETMKVYRNENIEKSTHLRVFMIYGKPVETIYFSKAIIAFPHVIFFLFLRNNMSKSWKN